MSAYMPLTFPRQPNETTCASLRRLSNMYVCMCAARGLAAARLLEKVGLTKG